MKLNITKNQIIDIIKNNLLVIVGTFILAVGTEYYLIPCGLVTGGVSGIGIIFGFTNIPISTELVISIVTWSLFFIGLFVLGWKFSAQTLVSTIVYTISLFLLNLLSDKFGFLILINSPSLNGNIELAVFLSSLFSGIFVGAGCAITYLGGGSTGGVDIITFILCKYIKQLKSSISIFAIDAIIVILGFIINPAHDLALCLEGVFSAFVAAIVIDRFMGGSNQTFVANIITTKPQEITEEVVKKLDRTDTWIDAKGGYTKQGFTNLLLSFSVREYNQVISLVRNCDRDAFMIITKAHEIHGYGFKDDLDEKNRTNNK